MKTNLKTRRGFTLVELLVVIVIIAALAGLTAPMVIRQRKKADQTEAVNNAKNIGIALFEFETEYGSYPDSSTAEEVKTNTGSELTLGTASSNDFFRQMIAAEISQSETMFYAKAPYSKKPDGVFSSSKALEEGEVGFGYIMNGDNGFSAAGNPSRPIIAAPLGFPFAEGQFDVDYYDSKAVILRLDNSAVSVPIIRDTKLAQIGGGKTLLETGSETVWGNDATPTMKNPLEK